MRANTRCCSVHQGEEDELKRNEKIQRASFEIKSHLVSTPDSNGSTVSAKAAAAASKSSTSPANSKLWALQQQLLATAAPTKGDSASDYSCQPLGSAPATANGTASTHKTSIQQDLQQQQQQQLDEQQQGVQSGARQQQQQQAPDSQQQQQLVSSQLTLTPQEVLQELLGDLFIDGSRLEMGEPLSCTVLRGAGRRFMSAEDTAPVRVLSAAAAWT
jgi:hypothetical protein